MDPHFLEYLWFSVVHGIWRRSGQVFVLSSVVASDDNSSTRAASLLWRLGCLNVEITLDPGHKHEIDKNMVLAQSTLQNSNTK